MPKLTKRYIETAEPAAEEQFLWDTDVKGFGIRVKPSGQKSFVLKYRLGKATRRHTISKVGSPYTVEEARERARALLRELASGADPRESKSRFR